MSDKVIARLERRLERERQTREQAERIAEDGLRRLYLANQDLDDRVAERTAELEQQRALAAASDADRQEFLRLLSRELRSPLNGVLGMLETLSAHLASDQKRLWADSAHASASLIESILTRLVLFVDLDTDPPEAPARMVADEVMTRIAHTWAHRLLKVGQLLSVESASRDVSITCYGGDVYAIFDEVLSNVVKHANPGIVRICVNADEHDAVHFTVIDSGPGFDDADTLLTQTAAPSSNLGRRGMGYALIPKLAARTDATVTVESAVGDCTVVRLSLPRTASDDALVERGQAA